MEVFFACLVAGLLIGYRGLLPRRWNKLTEMITTTGLLLLLFTMGAKIGSNPAVTGSLGTIGWQALVLSLGAVAGSILVLHLLERAWSKAGLGWGEERP